MQNLVQLRGQGGGLSVSVEFLVIMGIPLSFLLELVSYCDIQFWEILFSDSEFDQPYVN